MKVIGWQLARLVAEAQNELVGSVVEQIRRSPDRTRLALVVGSRRGKVHIIVGTRGDSAALYWTRTRDRIASWEMYERTEVFNRLRSAMLIGAGMAEKDRVVRFEFEKSGSDGDDVSQFALVAGWVGSMSNIWLLNPADDQILESFHSDASEASGARASKRRPLQLPESTSLVDWRALTFPEYKSLRSEEPDLLPADFMRRRLWGIDSGLARQIAEHRRGLRDYAIDPDVTPAARYREEFDALKAVGTAVLDPTTPLTFWSARLDPSEIRIASEPNGESSSLAELLALCDSREPRQSGAADDRKRLFTTIETALKKNERRLTSIDRTLAESFRADEYKAMGDILNANRQSLARGQVTAEFEDWRTGTVVSITLNPARTPQQNIDDYYRKSRKTADAITSAQSEKPRLMREQERLRAALKRLEAAPDSPDETRAIAVSLGWDAEPTQSGKGKNEPRLPYREFALGKERLWVGRSSRDNDELTLRFAKPQDIFFHVHGSPGSHVILKRDSKDQAIDKDVLTQAAQVAAYFSKAKHAGLVPVVYAEARFVRKPRKAPAGTVSVEREKTIMVRPLPPPGYHDKGPAN